MYPNIEKDKTLKQKTVSAMIWNGVGQFGALALTFISNLVLARLLLPSDFGCVGMLNIFINVSAAFVSGGLGAALVQKLDPTQTDYTTVFYWNIIVAIVCVVILFFAAPYIALFYNMPLLKGILRLQSINLIIGSFSMVQTVYLQRNLDFKKLSVRNLAAAFAGVIASITFALLGFGVWSLVYSSLISTSINVIMLWMLGNWRPTLTFSSKSLRELFSFGGLLFCSNIFETIYSNIQGLLIGKFYSAKLMGFYSQAKKLEEVPSLVISRVVGEVSFPVLSKFQNDKSVLIAATRKNLKCIAYLNFPLMMMCIVIAQPLFRFLFTAKWDLSIPYFQILCLGSMMYTVNTINTTVLKALRKGRAFLLVQVSKRLLGIIFILLGTLWGIKGLLWATTLTAYLFFFINAYMTQKYLGYRLLTQIKDLGSYYLLSIGIGVIVYRIFASLQFGNFFLVLLECIAYISIFLLCSYILKFDVFYIYLDILRNVFKSKI